MYNSWDAKTINQTKASSWSVCELSFLSSLSSIFPYRSRSISCTYEREDPFRFSFLYNMYLSPRDVNSFHEKKGISNIEEAHPAAVNGRPVCRGDFIPRSLSKREDPRRFIKNDEMGVGDVLVDTVFLEPLFLHTFILRTHQLRHSIILAAA